MVELWRCLTCVSIAVIKTLFSSLHNIDHFGSIHFLFHSVQACNIT